MKDCKLSDLEFFFNRDQGVIDVNGKPKENPKVNKFILVHIFC